MHSSDQPLALTDHLSALRGCLLRSILVLAAGFFAIFIFFASDLINMVLAPVRTYSFILGRVPDIGNLIAIHVLDKFVVTILISVIGAFFISVPYSFFELWKFLKPALRTTEKHVFVLFFPFVMLFFAFGAMFGYFFVIPVSIDFLANFGNESFALAGVETSLTIMSYLRYFFMMTFFLGVIFELPLLLMLIVRVTDLEPKDFARFRRHFIVLAFIIAMILTPPDVITQVMLALPMIVMYEFGIILTRIAQRKKIRIRNEFMQETDDKIENEIEKEKISQEPEMTKPDIITGFNKISAPNENDKDFENKKLDDRASFDKIDEQNEKVVSLTAADEEKPADIDPKIDKYLTDPDLSSLSKDQIKAILKIMKLYLDEKDS